MVSEEPGDQEQSDHGESDGHFCCCAQQQAHRGADAGPSGRLQVFMLREFAQHGTDEGAEEYARQTKKKCRRRRQ